MAYATLADYATAPMGYQHFMKLQVSMSDSARILGW
jgi:hypothetical protein